MSVKRKTQGRPIKGIVLLDKPTGIGSNQALQIVKTLFRARKAGHTGSLDRLASGLLPICFGEATKLCGFLLNADKHYLVTYKLGETSTTGDAEGEIIRRARVPALDHKTIEDAMACLCGEIQQIPPMYSALKHKGIRLYKLAHQGITVDREPRTITIHRHELIAHRGDLIDARVHCSKGTYIRTLAEDFGNILGCGARVQELRRTGVGPYNDNMVTLEQLQQDRELGTLDCHIYPPESALKDYPDVHMPRASRFICVRASRYLCRVLLLRVGSDCMSMMTIFSALAKCWTMGVLLLVACWG